MRAHCCDAISLRYRFEYGILRQGTIYLYRDRIAAVCEYLNSAIKLISVVNIIIVHL